ncbi:hypothetical protein CB1_000350072 [Camelus ferus]|nr:hypothetical protein CB1_000350072 [Camelus ferus]
MCSLFPKHLLVTQPQNKAALFTAHHWPLTTPENVTMSYCRYCHLAFVANSKQNTSTEECCTLARCTHIACLYSHVMFSKPPVNPPRHTPDEENKILAKLMNRTSWLFAIAFQGMEGPCSQRLSFDIPAKPQGLLHLQRFSPYQSPRHSPHTRSGVTCVDCSECLRCFPKVTIHNNLISPKVTSSTAQP